MFNLNSIMSTVVGFICSLLAHVIDFFPALFQFKFYITNSSEGLPSVFLPFMGFVINFVLVDV